MYAIKNKKALVIKRRLIEERETRFELATSTLARWCSTLVKPLKAPNKLII